jgi:hypothetical protein
MNGDFSATRGILCVTIHGPQQRRSGTSEVQEETATGLSPYQKWFRRDSRFVIELRLATTAPLVHGTGVRPEAAKRCVDFKECASFENMFTFGPLIDVALIRLC